MRLVSDANTTLRLVLPTDPQHEAVKAAIKTLDREGITVCYTPQVMREVYHTCMRPATSNGLGMTNEEAREVLRNIEASPMTLLNDVPAVYERWRELVDSVEINGRQTHDANHAAALKAHGVTHLLTLDRTDFNRYPGITVVRPEDVQEMQREIRARRQDQDIER